MMVKQIKLERIDTVRKVEKEKLLELMTKYQELGYVLRVVPEVLDKQRPFSEVRGEIAFDVIVLKEIIVESE